MNECNRCGECCKYIEIPYPYLRHDPPDPIDADFDRWLMLHGVALLRYANGEEHISIPVRCSALADDNTCTIYEDRPVLCQEWRPDSTEDAERMKCALGPALEEAS